MEQRTQKRTNNTQQDSMNNRTDSTSCVAFNQLNTARLRVECIWSLSPEEMHGSAHTKENKQHTTRQHKQQNRINLLRCFQPAKHSQAKSWMHLVTDTRRDAWNSAHKREQTTHNKYGCRLFWSWRPPLPSFESSFYLIYDAERDFRFGWVVMELRRIFAFLLVICWNPRELGTNRVKMLNLAQTKNLKGTNASHKQNTSRFSRRLAGSARKWSRGQLSNRASTSEWTW